MVRLTGCRDKTITVYRGRKAMNNNVWISDNLSQNILSQSADITCIQSDLALYSYNERKFLQVLLNGFL